MRALVTALILVGSTVLGSVTDDKGRVPQSVTHETLMNLIRKQDANAVVVNFWATWCPPCREEFPDFVKLGKEYADRDVNVLFVSADFPEDIDRVTKFLGDQRVPWRSYIKAGKDEAFINAFSKQWSGALPATFVYDRSGSMTFFHEGKLSYAEIENEVKKLLNSSAEK